MILVEVLGCVILLLGFCGGVAFTPDLFNELVMRRRTGEGAKYIAKGVCPNCGGKLRETMVSNCIGIKLGAECPHCSREYLIPSEVMRGRVEAAFRAKVDAEVEAVIKDRVR